MTESMYYGMEILIGIMIIPWTIFVTASIFSLKEQVALLKQELHLLEKLEHLLVKLGHE